MLIDYAPYQNPAVTLSRHYYLTDLLIVECIRVIGYVSYSLINETGLCTVRCGLKTYSL